MIKLSELQTHKELIASVLPFQPQVKTEHRNINKYNPATKAGIPFRFLIDLAHRGLIDKD